MYNFRDLDWLAVLLGVLFSIVWSSAFTTAWIIVQSVEPFTALTARFGVSAAIAIGLAKLLGQSFRLTRSQWQAVLLFGFFQNAVYLGANWVAAQWIEASLAAIIGSTMPLQVALLGGILLHDRLDRVGYLGLVAGFLGVLIILWPRMSFGPDGLGIILCVLASLGLCLATLVVRRATSEGNLLMIVGLQMVVGCLVVAIPAVTFESMQMPVWTTRLTLAFAYQVIMPGIVATLIWFTLVNRVGPTRASSFHYLNPFIGVAVAAVILGDRIGTMDILGIMVITLGIIAVSRTRKGRLI